MNYLTYGILDPSFLEECLKDTESGAEAVFIGRVRGSSRGKTVIRMEYEAHESLAEKVIDGIVKEAWDNWPVRHLFLKHRIGSLEPGDISILISVQTSHREEAFSACRYLIDQIKLRVPIWKKEFYSDSSQWLEETPL